MLNVWDLMLHIHTEQHRTNGKADTCRGWTENTQQQDEGTFWSRHSDVGQMLEHFWKVQDPSGVCFDVNYSFCGNNDSMWMLLYSVHTCPVGNTTVAMLMYEAIKNQGEIEELHEESSSEESGMENDVKVNSAA